MPPDVVRDLQDPGTPAERLQRGVELAVELIDGCDHAGVTVVLRRGGVTTGAATDDVVRRGDDLQYALGEGPCLDSVRQQQTVISDDLSTESRWTSWSPTVRDELGVHAMMSLLLYTHEDSYGALNLYADRARPWTPDSLTVGHSLAAHVAVAFAAARQIENLGRAITNRTVIGQAEGILMERLGVTSAQAFDYLRRVSQDRNVKLVALAEDLVRTRQLPSARPESGG